MGEPASQPGDVLRVSHCPECAYSLNGLPGRGRCPECGWRYDVDAVVVLFGYGCGSKQQPYNAPPRGPWGRRWNDVVAWGAACGLVAWVLYSVLSGQDPPKLIFQICFQSALTAGWLWYRKTRIAGLPGPAQVRLSRHGVAQRDGPGTVEWSAWEAADAVSLSAEGGGRYRLRVRRVGKLVRLGLSPDVADFVFDGDAAMADEVGRRVEGFRREALDTGVVG